MQLLHISTTRNYFTLGSALVCILPLCSRFARRRAHVLTMCGTCRCTKFCIHEHVHLSHYTHRRSSMSTTRNMVLHAGLRKSRIHEHVPLFFCTQHKLSISTTRNTVCTLVRIKKRSCTLACGKQTSSKTPTATLRSLPRYSMLGLRKN